VIEVALNHSWFSLKYDSFSIIPPAFFDLG
jgi:hypothetical protein